jgi:hypothetical protein
MLFDKWIDGSGQFLRVAWANLFARGSVGRIWIPAFAGMTPLFLQGVKEQ